MGSSHDTTNYVSKHSELRISQFRMFCLCVYLRFVGLILVRKYKGVICVIPLRGGGPLAGVPRQR